MARFVQARPDQRQAALADARRRLSAAYAKQGFAARELVTRWAEIAGPEIAAHAEPLKMQWPRPVEGQPQEPATLVLRVEGPMALEIQHSARRDPGAGQPLLRLERGRPAGAAPGAAVAPAGAQAARPPDPKAVAKVAEEPVGESRMNDLRDALARLGRRNQAKLSLFCGQSGPVLAARHCLNRVSS